MGCLTATFGAPGFQQDADQDRRREDFAVKGHIGEHEPAGQVTAPGPDTAAQAPSAPSSPGAGESRPIDLFGAPAWPATMQNEAMRRSRAMRPSPATMQATMRRNRAMQLAGDDAEAKR